MKILTFLFFSIFIFSSAHNKIYSKINSDTQNIANQIKSGIAKFISFGIVTQDFKKFKEKYGVGLKTEGCVVTSTLSKKATENNKILAKYLSEKYGETWKKDLPFKPFGLDEI